MYRKFLFRLNKKTKILIKKIYFRIVGILFGSIIYPISFLVQRQPKKIVVGGHTPFNDNSKYFFLLSHRYLKDYEIIWITNNKEVIDRIQNIGLKSYRTWSLKGLYHSLTAKIYVYSFHLTDINFWTSGGSTKVNLWHGIPLKDIAFSIKNGPSARAYDEKNILSRLARPEVFVRPDYMLTTSKSMTNYFAKAFRIQESQCLEYGMTRCDMFFWDEKKLMEHIVTYESSDTLDFIKSMKKYAKVYIYMPTWREKIDFLSEAKFDFVRLNEKLKKENILFIFKLHPLTVFEKINLDEVCNFSNLTVMDKTMDIYPILPFTDCLISDYSSIYYDYLLMKDKEVYLFPYDYEEYVLKSRTLAFDYEEQMPGRRFNEFNELLTSISKNILPRTKEQDRVKNNYFSLQEKSAVAKMSTFIKNITEEKK